MPEIKPAQLSSLAIPIEVVAQQWPKLRELVGKSDKSLPRLLASATPLAMEGDTLILGFEFPILKERFDGQEDAGVTVAQALGQLLDTECRVQTVVANQYEGLSSEGKIDDEDFAALADELGGVVQPRE